MRAKHLLFATLLVLLLSGHICVAQVIVVLSPNKESSDAGLLRMIERQIKLERTESKQEIRVQHVSAGASLKNLSAAVTQIVGMRPNIVITNGARGALEVFGALPDVPIILFTTQPLEALPWLRPGTRERERVTGLVYHLPLEAKTLEYAAMCVPKARALTFFDTEAVPDSDIQIEAWRRVATQAGLSFRRERLVGESLANELSKKLPPRYVGIAVFNKGFYEVDKATYDVMLQSNAFLIGDWAAFAESVGHLSVWPNARGTMESLGRLANAILSGTPPSQLPLERPIGAVVSVHQKRLERFGKDCVAGLVRRADNVH